MNTVLLQKYIHYFLFLFSITISNLYPSNSESQKVQGEHKKFLYVLPWVVVGGADRAAIALLNNIDIPPSEIDVCILERGGAFEKFLRKDIRIVTEEQASKVQYDVIAFNAFWLDPSVWAQKFHAKKRVQWIHTDLLGCNWKFPIMERSKCDSLDVFVCVSEKSKASFIKIHPDLASKTVLIQNIIDGPEIRREAKESIFDMPKNDHRLSVVTVGRLSYEKGIDRAIAVHKRLNKEGYSFRWYVVGGGDEKTKLEQNIAAAGLKGKFILLGEKMNPYPYIKQADIFVLPSRFEGRPLAISEAQILGLPIVTTAVSGVRESIVSGKNGLIVPNNDEALYRGMKHILSDAKMRKKFRKNLKGFEYDNRKSLQQLHKILRA